MEQTYDVVIEMPDGEFTAGPYTGDEADGVLFDVVSLLRYSEHELVDPFDDDHFINRRYVHSVFTRPSSDY